MRESVVQIPVVSTIKKTHRFAVRFLYAVAKESNHLLSLAKAKDSRCRELHNKKY